MAFSNKKLSVIAYANGFTMWHYISPDTAATIAASGYFNSVSSLMNIGDLIIINSSGGTTGIYKITATSPAVTITT